MYDPSNLYRYIDNLAAQNDRLCVNELEARLRAIKARQWMKFWRFLALAQAFVIALAFTLEAFK